MALSVPTPSGTLDGVALFNFDGTAWQPSGRAMPDVATPTGVLDGVAGFTWNGTAWAPTGVPVPSVATPSGILDGVAIYVWNGSAWIPSGGKPSVATPSGVLRGVAAFSWDGANWQPIGQAAPDVPTPYGVLRGIAPYNWNGSTWIPGSAGGAQLDIDLTQPTLDSRITYSRAGTATDGSYLDAAGSTYNTYAANVPRINSRGLLLEFGVTNYLLNSDAPATQTTASLAVGNNYCLWVVGTGSAAVTAGTATITGAGTATAGTYDLFNVTVAGTVTITVTGSLTRFQLEQGSAGRYGPSSYVPTTGATASRGTDAASLALPAPWFNPSAYSFVVDTGEPWPNVFGGNAMTTCELYGGAGNRLWAGYGATLAAVSCLSGGTTQFQDNNTISNTTVLKSGLSIDALTPVAISCVNGLTPTTHTGFSLYAQTLNTQLSMTGTGGAIVPANQRVKRLRFWTRALAATDLQALTTVTEPVLDYDFTKMTTLDARFAFSRGSAASYFDVNGVLQQAASTAPRFDYDPVLHTINGLLLEGASTNAIFPSGNVATAFAPTNTTLTANIGVAPDGTTTMSRFAEMSIGGAHWAAFTGLTVTASSVQTFSIYAKAQENQYLQLYYDDNTSGCFATFDLGNGVISTAVALKGAGTASGATITPVGNGVYRCSISGIAGSSTTVRCGPIHTRTAVSAFAPTYLGDATRGLLLWGAQFEAGSFPTSYVATTAAAATRSADLCTFASNAAWRNATAESWKAEYIYYASQAANVRVLGSAASQIAPLYLSSGAVSAKPVGTYDQVATLTSVNTVPAMSIVKHAATWQSGPTAQVCGSAGPVASSAALTNGFSTMMNMKVMGDSLAGETTFGWMRRVSYWPRVLSAAEMQQVTT